MTALGLLLWFKIGVTAATAVLPMLLLPARLVAQRLGIEPSAVGFIRLYGVALLALLVGYAQGLVMLADGLFPTGVVWMGLVSNGGAALALVTTGLHRRLRLTAPLYGLIALGLAAALVWPALAVRPLGGL